MTEQSGKTISDKVTLGVSTKGQEAINRLIEFGYFKTELAAFQAAAALALHKGLDWPESKDVTGTKWNRGSGTIAQTMDFLEWYLPTDTPVRALERLGEAGLIFISDRIIAGYRISDIFEIAEVLEV